MPPQLRFFLPELLLGGAAAIEFCLARWRPKAAFRPVCSLIAFAAAIASMTWGDTAQGGIELDGRFWIDDAFANCIRTAVSGLGVLVILTAWNDRRFHAGMSLLVLLSAIGLMLAARMNHLVLLFIGGEVVAVACLFLVFLAVRRNSSATSSVIEPGSQPVPTVATMSVASLLLLAFGIALLCGVGGGTNLTHLRETLGTSDTTGPSGSLIGAPSRLGVLALVSITAGAGARMGLVPFALNSPDLAERCPAWCFAWASLVQRLSGFVILVRVPLAAMRGYEATGQLLLIVIAAATLATATLMLWRRERLYEMLACVGMGHAGLAAAGLATAFGHASQPELPEFGALGGVSAAMLLLAADIVAIAGTAACLSALRRGSHDVKYVEDLAGLGRQEPLLAVCLTVCLLSLTGLPLLAGFWAWILVLLSMLSVPHAVGAGDIAANHPAFLLLAVLALAAMLTTAAVVLRMLSKVLFERPIARFSEGKGGATAAAVLAAAFLVATGAFPGPLMKAVGECDQIRGETLARTQDGEGAATPKQAIHGRISDSRGETKPPPLHQSAVRE